MSSSNGSNGNGFHPKPLETKSRAELLATLKPKMRQYLRPDTGDMPLATEVQSATV